MMGSIAGALIENGWNQGAGQGPDGRLCLIGAACMAHDGYVDALYFGQWDELPRPVVRAVVEAIGGDPDRDKWGENVWEWNDDHVRTYDEVLRAAKHADEILDAQ